MRKSTLFTLVLLSMITLASCKSNTESSLADSSTKGSITADQSITEEGQTDNNVASEPAETEQEEQTINEPSTHSEYKILSFSAIQGAVITDLEYNEEGYLSSCSYYEKCEACGTVYNTTNHVGNYGTVQSSFICRNCGNNQTVEIQAIEDWVEIPD